MVADAVATTTSFRLASPGLREYNFRAAPLAGAPYANLYLLGADYEISGLTPGLNYFARVKVSLSSPYLTPLLPPI